MTGRRNLGLAILSASVLLSSPQAFSGEFKATYGEIYAQLADTTRALLERTREAGFAKAYYPIMIQLLEATPWPAAQPAA